MQRATMLTRTLIAAFVIAAIAAPSAVARPIDSYAPAPAEPAPQRPAPFSPEAPLYWGYGDEAGVLEERAATTGSDTPWEIIGLGISGGVLMLGGLALAGRNVVRARRARVAA